MERGFPYCMAHMIGRRKCGCAMCKTEIKIHRENRLLIWGGILAFAVVVAMGLFSARAADCHRGSCFGSCNTMVGCPGANCGCVPTMPNSPLGTCVGSG